jgi:hypothetical protein
MNMKSIVRLFSLAAIVAGSVVLTGCGGRPDVKGTVSVRGTKLNAGTVTFRSGDLVRGATIQPDGSFAIPECPPGQYKVTVEVPNLKFQKNPTAVPKAAPMPGKVESTDPPAAIPVAVDAKYRDADRSGLTYTVSSEVRNIDIELR